MHADHQQTCDNQSSDHSLRSTLVRLASHAHIKVVDAITYTLNHGGVELGSRVGKFSLLPIA